MTGAITDRFALGMRVGDYILEREVPATASELAYIATHVVLPRRARVVVLEAEGAGPTPVAVQLLREACILEALHHPGVPRVFECGVIDRRPWIAMELVEGTTIEDILSFEALTVVAVLALLRDAGAILAHAHRRGVIHGSLAPSSLLRRPAELCITGWGAAHLQDAASKPRAVIDPPCGWIYRAPELVSGGPFDGRSDVFALGVIAYEALTLMTPTMSLARRLPGVPAALSRLVDRMLATDPIARPSSAEVRAEAMRILELVDVPLADAFDHALDHAIEEVEVELVDISRQPPPAPRAKIRWTPAPGVEPCTTVAAIKPAQRPLD